MTRTKPMETLPCDVHRELDRHLPTEAFAALRRCCKSLHASRAWTSAHVLRSGRARDWRREKDALPTASRCLVDGCGALRVSHLVASHPLGGVVAGRRAEPLYEDYYLRFLPYCSRHTDPELLLSFEVYCTGVAYHPSAVSR